MRLSLNWIARCLGTDRVPVSVIELRERLTKHVAEIGAVHQLGASLDHVVVGRVLTCAQHPNADRLRVTTVDVGGKVIPVVCGAPNVAVDQLVCVALPGAQVQVTGKDGAPTTITIKTGKLRGEASDGMLCAADELGLPGGHDGIVVLSGSPAVGTPIAEVLAGGDSVFEIENIAVTHRPDLWGHLGWAREVAAVCALTPPAAPDASFVAGAGPWSVRLDDPGCTTYLAAVVEGLSDGPSPDWMVRGLEAVGCRSLGRLIDVTNWVMYELGHPLHAFDAYSVAGHSVSGHSVSGHTIVVRPGVDGEVFAGLDGRSHMLAANDIVISDGARALALAGVVGGTASGVSATTTAVVIEAAVFAPTRIRRSRQRLAIATDAAARFEKSLQPESAAAALNRAITLLAQLCPGSRVVQRFGAGPSALPDTVIPFDPHLPERVAGTPIPAEEAVAYLTRLGLDSISAGQRVPWWRRKDLTGAHDLCEEVMRLHGYDRIVPTAPRLPMVAPAVNALRQLEHRVRAAASAAGWDEVAGYAFTSDAWAAALGWTDGVLLRITHPLSSEQTVMRPSLLPGLAEASARNRKHHLLVRLFEVGRRYARGIGADDQPDERMTFAGVFSAHGDDTPFYAARDGVLSVLTALGISSRVTAAGVHPGLVAGRSAVLHADKRELGVVGELPGTLRQLAGLDGRAAWFELDLAAVLAALPMRAPQHHPPSRFQRAERDFTFVTARSVAYGELAAACRQGAGELFTDVNLVGCYRGDGIPADAQAISLRVGLQADDRTLGDSDLARVSDRIVTTVSKRTGATLRG